MIYKKHGEYSGFFCLGKKHYETDTVKPFFEKTTLDEHLDRASWLTAMVETQGLFGTVISYDGTGITAGIHQATGVLPKADLTSGESQGTLWELLCDMYPLSQNHDLYYELWKKFDLRDNHLYYANLDYLVSGNDIRKTFNGFNNGQTHEAGPIANRSIKWIMLFSDLFSMPETFDCQIQFGKKFFKRFINRITKEYPFMKDEYEISHVDLAMCILLSHSVNAPSVAYNLLCQSFNTKSESSIHWAKKLIRLLGTSKYGRWDDDIKNGRYQRTRTYAQKSGFWPDFHFNDDGIMPKDIIE